MDLIEANSTPDYALQCIKWCIEHGDLAALTEHLRHHNSKVKHEIIPLLFQAFSNQQVEAVKIMLPSLDQEILTLSSLNRGALLNKLLCSAVETGDVDIVKDLINKGADLDCNFHGKPLLHIAACYGYTNIVTVLVDAGSKIDSRDRFGDGIIHSILTSQSLSKGTVVRLLIKLGASPLVKSSSGKLPIHIAAKNAPDVLNVLIQEGANVNIVDDVNRETPLHIACGAACRETILTLIQSGSTVNITNRHGQTPLAKLLKFINNDLDFHTKTRLDIARTLISLGFRMNCQTSCTQYSRGRDKGYDKYKSLKLSLKSPSSLQNLSRIAVRGSFKFDSDIVKDICQLDIPVNLKSYLLFNDVNL